MTAAPDRPQWPAPDPDVDDTLLLAGLRRTPEERLARTTRSARNAEHLTRSVRMRNPRPWLTTRIGSTADAAGLIRLLTDNGVAFIIIGGIAQCLHGYARNTYGLDICYEPGRLNAARLAEVLTSIEAEPIGWPPDVQFEAESWIAEQVNGRMTSTAGDIGVWGEPAGNPGFEVLMSSADAMPIAGRLGVPVVGLDALLDLKRARDTNKDRADLSELVRLRELKLALDVGATPPPWTVPDWYPQAIDMP